MAGTHTVGCRGGGGGGVGLNTITRTRQMCASHLPLRGVEVRGACVQELIECHQQDVQLIMPKPAAALMHQMSRDRRLSHRRQPTKH